MVSRLFASWTIVVLSLLAKTIHWWVSRSKSAHFDSINCKFRSFFYTISCPLLFQFLRNQLKPMNFEMNKYPAINSKEYPSNIFTRQWNLGGKLVVLLSDCVARSSVFKIEPIRNDTRHNIFLLSLWNWHRKMFYWPASYSTILTLITLAKNANTHATWTKPNV